jgi:hypothetical protein
MTGLSLVRSGFLVLCVALADGCAAPPQKAELASELEPFRVESVPEGATRTFVDLGGKLHLVAVEISPQGTAAPGSTVHLKMYWQPVGELEPGWGLFTHLVDERGERIRNFDGEGAFRKWVTGKQPDELSLLELGKIYVDEQSLEMPKPDEVTPEVSVIVGAWSGDIRLPVLSGPTDGHSAALLATFNTGVPRGRPKAQARTAGQGHP